MNALVSPIGQNPNSISPHSAPYFLQSTALLVLTFLFPNLVMGSNSLQTLLFHCPLREAQRKF